MPGPQGEEGPAGPNQILPASLYVRQGNTQTLPAGPNTSANSAAICDPGDIVLEGSQLVSAFSSYSSIANIASGSSNNVNQYDLTVQGNAVSFRAEAVCFNNP